MPCDWKATLRQFASLILDASADPGRENRATAPQFAGPIGRQKYAPSATPPPWLARRNKRPAQRGGPRS